MAALIEKHLGPDAIIIALPADHVILDISAFHAALQSAVSAAADGYLVTLGIPPTGPDTGFGYIQRGELAMDSHPPVFDVKQFREKPDKEVAEQYVASGDYFWNAGMIIATVGRFRTLYKQYLPEMEPALAKLVDAAGTPREGEVFDELFPTLTKISVDYGIIEKADRVAVVPAEMGWNDVGSWDRLADVLADKANAAGCISTGELRVVDSSNALVHAPGKLVALIGLENIVVIDTPDALLIADRNSSADVKKIVELLQAEGRKDLL
jgi:mannose-1-phosphate guanylyltransferase/mannose-6-phosphate isomerase